MKKVEIVTIDGAAGEGGGQILRTSLALSLLSQKPFRIINIRAGRKKPGLLRQHLTAVQAAGQIGNAVTDGAEIGSLELVFRPEAILAGEYRFAIGTAGSTTLVLQTILPALMLGTKPSRITLEGGTHNPLAPSHDFLCKSFLPLLARCGPQVTAALIRPGFCPAGGGRMEIQIAPAEKLLPMALEQRGPDLGRRVVAHLAGLDRRIAERAFERVSKRMNWDQSTFEVIEHPEACGPGFVLIAEIAFEHVVEVCTGFGQKGVRAENVADDVVDQVRRYLSANAPAGEYLTDQLLLPLALSGAGAFRSIGLSRHARTNIDVIHQFLPVRIETKEQEGGAVDVRAIPG